VPKHLRNPETISKPAALLVEGADDRAVILQLIKMRGLANANQLEIFEYDGKDKLRQFLKAFVVTEGFRANLRAIAIVRDADDDPAAAVDSIRDSLTASALQVPNGELQKTAGIPAVAFLLLPGGTVVGCLEDVCLLAVAADPLLPHARTFIQTVSGQTAEPPSPQSKAVIHTYLATRREPGLPLGKASGAGYIDVHHAAFDRVSQLVQLVIAP
jgi:hypothetical protein